jgi:hypothetical protein
VRVLLLIAFAGPWLLAQDAHEIVRRAIELERNNSQNWLNYTYLEHQVQRQFDSAGKVKTQTIRTFDVTNLEGSPYRRLVARDDQPLSPQEQQAEEEKLQRSIVERRNEPKEQRDRRIAEWHRRQEKQREPVYEVPDAFDFRIVGEEKVDGHVAWVIDGVPKPGFKPKSLGASILPKMKGRFWISKTDYHWIKLDAETTDTFAYGALLIRIGKGAHIVIENTRVNDEVWLPKRIALTGSARILLVKGIRAQIDFAYSNYKKFQVDSRVVSTGER